MSEYWKDVIDFEGLYQVSNFGNLRRHPDKQSTYKYRVPKSLERKTHVNKLGYLYATLCKNNISSKKTVHQLVAAAFITGFEYGMIINHLDGDKQNNTLSNLEICTYQDNNLHAHKNGLTIKPGESKFHNVYIQTSRDKTRVTGYAARVKDMYETIYYERFNTEEDAARAVDSFLNSIGDTRRNRNFPTPKMPND